MKRTQMLVMAVLLVSGCAEKDEESDADVPVDGPADGAEDPGEEGCAEGLTLCFGRCVDIGSDHAHCGGCGNVCAPHETCTDGACLLECPSGETNCGGTCTDTQSDHDNCGSCGNACSAEQVCSEGACALGCAEGLTDCSGSCVNTLTSRQHCGECDHACELTEVCEGGECICTPSCGDRTCGDDGCGGACGRCAGDTLCTSSGACASAPRIDFRLGVCYHATGADFNTTAFLSQYHVASVRDQVRSQLQAMADAGAHVIKTMIWLVAQPSDTAAETWKWHFPPSDQELENLAAFAADVASVRASDGHLLELALNLGWLWCADYTTGSPTGVLGECDLTAADFGARTWETVDGILGSVRSVYRADGLPVVHEVYLASEVMVGAKENEDWFLTTFWPGFTDRVRDGGLVPSVYFLAGTTEAEILDNTYEDAEYPVLDRHRSMYWVYRSLKFMADGGLPVPERIDFSLYASRDTVNHATLVSRIFDDLEAVAPHALGPSFARLSYGVVEAHYLADASRRLLLGKAFAAEHVFRGSNPDRVIFWTTPDGGGPGVNAAFPFQFSDYSTAGLVTPALPNASFEQDTDGDTLPEGFENVWANGDVQSWRIFRYVNPGDVKDGSAALRFETGTCSTCTGSWDGTWAASDSVPVTGGDIAVVRLWMRNAATMSGDQAISLALIDRDASGAQLASGTYMRAVYSPWTFERYVIIHPSSPEAASFYLRMGTMYLWDQVVDFDMVH